jgi:hypothetical protein
MTLALPVPDIHSHPLPLLPSPPLPFFTLHR